jgi:hypothetical protein
MEVNEGEMGRAVVPVNLRNGAALLPARVEPLSSLYGNSPLISSFDIMFLPVVNQSATEERSDDHFAVPTNDLVSLKHLAIGVAGDDGTYLRLSCRQRFEEASELLIEQF